MSTSQSPETRVRLGAFVLDLVLVAALVAAILVFMVPSFSSWYHDDDFHNLRWVLEYRYAPWKALTERQSLHDHIRPLTLLALWVGTRLSDGGFWGPHGVCCALELGGLFGVMVLGRELDGSRRAALLAGLFGATMWGFVRMTDWTAWMGSSGEICCGIWAVVAARRALSEVRWLPVAALLLVCAGLFKEPGSVVYPLTAGVMGASALFRDRRNRRAIGVALLPAVGAATFAYTWIPANVERLGTVNSSEAERLWEFLEKLMRQNLNGSPGWQGMGGHWGAGIPLVLLFAALLWELLEGSPGHRPEHRLLWLLSAFGLTLLGLTSLGFTTVLCVLLVGTILVRRRRDPPIGLVLLVLAIGVMLPFDLPNEVQLLSGSFGLALVVAVATSQMLSGPPGAPRASLLTQGLALGCLLMDGGLLFGRILEQTRMNYYEPEKAIHAVFLGFGAVAQTVGVNTFIPKGLVPQEQEALPLVGLLPGAAAPPGDTEDIYVEGGILLRITGSAARDAFLTGNLLHQRLPVADAASPTARPALAVVLDPGTYALGTWSARGAAESAEATDACGDRWRLSSGDAVQATWHLAPFVVRYGCTSLSLSRGGGSTDPNLVVFLAPLKDAVLSVRWPFEIPRTLDVDAASASAPPSH